MTWFAGIDENGLGPRLGPLVVTGVWATSDGYNPRTMAEAVARPFDVRDSKQVFSQRGLARGESAALSLICAISGDLPETGGDLVRMLDPVRSGSDLPCIAHGALPMCDTRELKLPLYSQREEIEKRAFGLGEALAGLGIRERGARCMVMCPFEMNTLMRAGRSKLDVDLQMFMTVARDIRAARPVDGTMVCGKVGARTRYASLVGPGTVTLAERREMSSYDVAGLGRVHFVLDADDSDPLVSMASLVGKYLREVIMHAIWQTARRLVGEIRRPSGYHDTVTTSFIERAGAAMREAGACPDCIERIR